MEGVCTSFGPDEGVSLVCICVSGEGEYATDGVCTYPFEKSGQTEAG